MLLNFVNFEYHKTLAEQVELFVRVQQIVIFAAPVIRSQDIEKISEVEILLPIVLLFQYYPEIPLYEFVEGVEGRYRPPVLLYLFDIQVDRHGKSHLLGTGDDFRIPFSERHDQRFNGLLLLQVKDLVVSEKRIESYRMFFTIGIIHAILTVCALADQVA